MKLIYAFLGLVLMVGACSQQRQHEEHSHEHDHSEENIIHISEEQMQEFGIETKQASPGELHITFATRGRIALHPDRLAHILPKISGVAKNAFGNIGDHVREGDILAILESREMADIKANYLAAKEKERLALNNLGREQRLFEKKVSAEQDYINAKSAFQEAKINTQLAEQKLQAFGLAKEDINELALEVNPDLRVYSIRSPIDGIVIARHITKGEFIETTQTIYEIADLSTIWIEIGVYPKDLAKVQVGQIVDISLPMESQTAQAKIIYVSPIIQDETITAKAVAEMKNPQENWRPGSFVNVNIATENVIAPIVISREAIQEMDGKDYVFVKVPKGFEKRQIQLGIGDSNFVAIQSGLKEGESYAVSKTFLLKADLKKEEAEHVH